LDLAALYSRLLTEWLGSANHGADEAALDDTDSLDGSLEIIQKDRLKQLKDKFEAVVFTPQETDEVEIDNYLFGLFAGDNGEKHSIDCVAFSRRNRPIICRIRLHSTSAASPGA
jgi:hypothetical protein